MHCLYFMQLLVATPHNALSVSKRPLLRIPDRSYSGIADMPTHDNKFKFN